MNQLNASFPIVDDNGLMTDAFRDQMNRLNKLIPLTGTGTPEAILEAPQFSVYLDETGGAGAIEYRKMLTNIGGDRTKGWQLV